MSKFKQILFSMIIIFFAFNIKAYALQSAGNLVYEGIDVSDWQGYIDYEEVRNSGIDIVYIKASQGSYIKDAYFDINYENAKRNNLKVGFYHFLTATNEEEARQEARFFASVISGKMPDCKLVLDYEVFGYNTVPEINDIAIAFLEEAQSLTNKEFIIYSDLSNAETTFGERLAQNYELWLAYYGNYNELSRIPTSWEEYIGVQYTDTGYVDGIGGNVDRDIFTEDVFLSDTSEISGEVGENFNTNTIDYVVKQGDTLSEIASEYNTTVAEIAQINNISNPNLIYPGEVLRLSTNSTVPAKETRQLGEIVYTVRRGNTLSQIALAYNVSVEELVEMNNITNPNLIYPGEKIRITNSDSNELNPIDNSSDVYYIVKPGDTLYGIARKFGVSINYILDNNYIANPNLIYVGQRIIV